MKDTGGTGFWHETYFMSGGMEAIYLEMAPPVGLARFAPRQAARGEMFSSRRRAGLPGHVAGGTPVGEEEVYSG
jgi:hypothetical protein